MFEITWKHLSFSINCSVLSTEAPKSENDCNSTGLVVGMTFVVSDASAQTQVTVNAGTAKVDEAATMMCTYTLVPNDALLQLSWTKADENGQPVGNALVTSTGQPNNGRYSFSNDNLIITDVERGDAVNYRCAVSTVNGNPGDDFANLTVYYLEVPDLKPVELHATLNETATFICSELEGLPTPITITWIKDDNPLGVPNTDKYPTSDATLTINDVDERDEGAYQCRAENAAYIGEEGKLSNTATLSIVLSTEVPKRENDCNSTGLVGMTFVGVLIGFIICLLVVVIISKIRKSQAQVKYNSERRTKSKSVDLK
ncbi:protein sax-3-like [Antedon mediterranea]|uniref:protein sax-3-like n=1 Tax=Antedon mediterranea TaxID=105859 RepID=UPI003AF5623D